MAITMKVETITPAQAAHYLKRNVDNYRKISKQKVTLYAEEMKAGKWQLNGEAIMLDETGRLKNGQHRLAAVLQAGIPVKMAVITGVADDVTIFDSGMNRSVRQIAAAGGRTNISGTETAVATAIVGGFGRVSRGRVLAWIETHGDELARVFRLCQAQNKNNLSCRMSCVLAGYMMTELEGMKAYELEVFFRIFNSGNIIGTDGYEPSSALVARRMFEERYKSKPSNAQVIRDQTEIMIQALRDFKKHSKRQLNYQIKEPLACVQLMNKLRKADGLKDEKEG